MRVYYKVGKKNKIYQSYVGKCKCKCKWRHMTYICCRHKCLSLSLSAFINTPPNEQKSKNHCPLLNSLLAILSFSKFLGLSLFPSLILSAPNHILQIKRNPLHYNGCCTFVCLAMGNSR